MEVQPAVAVRMDCVSVEYSHTIRTFGQDDQFLTRQYTRFGYQGGANGTLGAPYMDNFVPDNTTNIDRLKVQVDLTECNQLYANMYLGQTRNQFRDTERQFGGFDVRLTNRSIDGVTMTAYSSMYDENNQLPPTAFQTPPFGAGVEATGLDHPVDYNRTRHGLKGNWRPFEDSGNCDPCYWNPWSTLRIAWGYEYQTIARDFARYSSQRLGTFTQPDTKIHELEFGPSLKCSPETDTYIRYKVRFAEDPLIGVRESQGRFNTNLPEQLHRVDIGGTWMPAKNVMATAQLGLAAGWNDSFYPSNAVGNRPIRFTEHDYPVTTTLWWAPTECVSLTAGYAYTSNFINQDITVGFRGPEQPNSPFETAAWDYQGENHLISLSGTYAWTPCVNLLGGVELSRGSNSFDVPPMTDPVIPGATPPNWSLLPSYSAVRVQTLRLTAGVDWQPYHHITLYQRYVFFDWDDLSQGTYDGTSHMVLAGAEVLW